MLTVTSLFYPAANCKVIYAVRAGRKIRGSIIVQLKPIVLGLSVIALSGCTTTGNKTFQTGDESLNEILTQYDSNRYVIISDPHALSAAERNKLEGEGYKLLKTESVGNAGYTVRPVNKDDLGTDTLNQYVTRDGVNYRLLEPVVEEPESPAQTLEADKSEEEKYDSTHLLASTETSVEQALVAAKEIEAARLETEKTKGQLTEVQSITEAQDAEIKAMQKQMADVQAKFAVLEEEKRLAEAESEAAKPIFEWYAGETLQQSLRRWVTDAGYNQLVWYVYDSDGDIIEIPIAANHAFESHDLQIVLSTVKRAYATAPKSPISLDFIIKKGNKTVVVSNAGAAQ